MSLKQYLLIMSLVTVVAYILVASVASYFDPTVSGLLPIVFFYASLSLALIGTFTLIGFAIRSMRKHSAMAFREVIISLRQAIWFTILIVGSLGLMRLQILNILNLLLVLLALTALELYFLNKKAVR